MSNSTEAKEEPKLENSDKKSLQAIVAGVIGAFLLPFFFIAIPYWLDNSDVSPVEALLLDPAFGGVVGFILARVLIGLIFGYLAYLILKNKKNSYFNIWGFFCRTARRNNRIIVSNSFICAIKQ